MLVLAALLLLQPAPVPLEPLPEPGPDGYLGVQVPPERSNGLVVISEVVEDGPAHKAGVRPGDAIVQLGLYQPRDSNDLIKRIRSHRPGQTVVLTVQRDGEKLQFRVKLGRRPEDLDPVPGVPDRDR